jgi:hypothetical protein
MIVLEVTLNPDLESGNEASLMQINKEILTK